MIMKSIKTLVAASFASCFVFVIASQSSFGQHGATFLPDQDEGAVAGTQGSPTFFNVDRTPSMKRPYTRITPPGNRTRPTSNRSRSIGVASPTGTASGRNFQQRKPTGYADIRRPSTDAPRRPDSAGPTAEFF
jgi:hypothetical protein